MYSWCLVGRDQIRSIYFNVPAIKHCIDTLFYNVFKYSLKVPGLSHHDIQLHLKTKEAKRQKDLRPVASLNSIPKRMLKILYSNIKTSAKDIFYCDNDFSAPGRGCDMAVFNVYENLERAYYGKSGKRRLVKESNLNYMINQMHLTHLIVKFV